jgi:glycosyltransferase involved in cell wall biosynthesis
MLSFIIPAHNEERLIAAAVASARRAAEAAGEAFEIIVVDDASDDGTGDKAREAGARVIDVKLRKIAAVRNAGAGAARGEVLVFLDGDTVLPVETLAAALAALRGGAVGGGACVAFDQPMRWAVKPMFLVWVVVQRLFTLAAGCFVFVRREDFTAVGGFDEQFYVSEEIHLSNALKRRGRFVILRQHVVTSGRKTRMYSPGQLVAMSLRLLCKGPRAWKRPDGLEFWYGGKREGREDPRPRGPGL